MSAQVQLARKLAILVVFALVCVYSETAMAADKLVVKDSSGSTSIYVVTDTGQVTNLGRAGVGTTSPSTGLHVKGNTYPENCIKAEGNAATQGAGYLGYIVRPGELPVANDRLGFFLFGSMSGANPVHAVGLSAVADYNWSSTSTPGYLSFLTTANGQVTRYERLKIRSDGVTEVFGGIRLNKNAGSPAKPACDSSNRGTMWYTQGTTSKDSVEICTKDASNNYDWRLLW